VGAVYKVIRDFGGVGALLNVCQHSKLDSNKETALEILFHFTEIGRRNQDHMRKNNAIYILWNMLMARIATRSVMRVIISMCKFSTLWEIFFLPGRHTKSKDIRTVRNFYYNWSFDA
jgi:hypothetical protein